MAGLSGLDLAILAVVAFGAWRGGRTGALHQVFAVVGLVVGVLAGLALSGPVGDLVVTSLGLSDRLAPALGFVTTCGAVIAAAAILARVTRGALNLLKLGALDRFAGAGVGGLRAALFLSVLLLVGSLGVGGEPFLISRDARTTSVFYEPVRQIAPAAWEALKVVAPRVGEALPASVKVSTETADAR